jgi:hypothetical protein
VCGVHGLGLLPQQRSLTKKKRYHLDGAEEVHKPVEEQETEIPNPLKRYIKDKRSKASAFVVEVYQKEANLLCLSEAGVFKLLKGLMTGIFTLSIAGIWEYNSSLSTQLLKRWDGGEQIPLTHVGFYSVPPALAVTASFVASNFIVNQFKEWLEKPSRKA